MSNLVESALLGDTKLPLVSTLAPEGVVIGRYYTLHARIAVGGMASVYLGWLAGAADFSRVVAIKRMHPQFALNEQFAARFRDEARLNARLSHPNIVQVFDVVERNRELLIVMEYVHGVALGNLAEDAHAATRRLPPSVVAGILAPALHGLHAAHEATDDEGRPMGIVHRDFSPQNIIVSSEGHSKILDFGVAKARTHMHVTSTGRFSGKLGYCSPEQVSAGRIDRRTDVFAAGVVLWEMLAGERLFHTGGIPDSEAIRRVLTHPVRPPSSVNPEVPSRLDEIVLRALDRRPERRFADARELAGELETAVAMASPSTIAEYVESVCAKRIARLTRTLSSARRSMARAQVSIAIPAAVSPGQVTPTQPEPEHHTTGPTVRARISAAVRNRWGMPLAIGAALVVFACAAWLRSRPLRDEGAKLVVPTAPYAPPVRHTPEVMPLTDTPRQVQAVSASLPAQLSAGESRVAPTKLHSHAHPNKGRFVPTRLHAQTGSAPPKAPNAPSCDPPTYLDSDGIRIFKDECL